MKKKPGAPPGNRNALKHGFYARSFSPAERNSLASEMLGQFKDEIPLLRVLLARTAQSLQQQKGLSFEDQLSALRTVTLAIGRLESLTRTQTILAAGLSPTAPPDRYHEELDLLESQELFLDCSSKTNPPHPSPGIVACPPPEIIVNEKKGNK